MPLIKTIQNVDIHLDPGTGKFSATLPDDSTIQADTLDKIVADIKTQLKKQFKRVPIVVLNRYGENPTFTFVTSVTPDGRGVRTSNRTHLSIDRHSNNAYVVDEHECATLRGLMADMQALREKIKAEADRLMDVLPKLTKEHVDPSLTASAGMVAPS